MLLVVNDRIKIPYSEFDWSYVRSSGSGGQNVNKVNSKAVLSWSPLMSNFLPADVRDRFRERFGHRLSVDGILIIQSDRYRDQPRNAADCLEKLRLMLVQVAHAPKKRKPTRPTRSSVAKRLEKKRRHSLKKRERSSVIDSD